MADANEPAKERIKEITTPTDEFYYNARTGEVEQGKVSSSRHRMGPYPTREAAAEAFGRAADRNEAWEAEDRAWEGEER